jgi:broad specificity phosphatase PhoE
MQEIKRETNMTKLIIVRHGFSTSNLKKTLTGHLDAELSEMGQKQGVAVSEYLYENYKFDHIYSSDLKRAVQTVAHLSTLSNMPIIKDQGLREICCGVWEGLPLTQIMQEYTEDYEKWHSYSSDVCPEGGETFSELQQRAFKALTKIAEENQGKTIIVATHGGFIKVVQGNLLGLALERLGEIPYLPNAAIIELEYCDGKFKIASEVIDSYLDGMKTEMPKGI